MSSDPNKLTPGEVHAVSAMLEACKRGNTDEARWWSARPELLAALAKMRAQAAKEAS